MTSETNYGTRWRRAAFGIVAGVLGISAMTGAVLTNVAGFEANLTVMNPNADTDLNGFSFSSNQIHAVDAGFGMAPMKLQNGTWKNVLRAGFRTATITGLCLSKVESLPVLGNYTVTLSSPGTITADNGVFDLTDIVGDKSSTGIALQGTAQIGLATPDITTVFANGSGIPFQGNPFGETNSGSSPLKTYTAGAYNAGASGVNGNLMNGQGYTGIDVSGADLYKVFGRLWQIQLSGHITLPKLKISVTAGKAPCASWPSNAPATNAQPWP